MTDSSRSKPRLKILFTAETYHPVQNGVVASMDSFKKIFESLGHQVLVVVPRTGPAVDDETVLRVPAIHLLRPQPDYGLSLPTRETVKRLMDFKPDIIHAQHMFRMGGLAVKVARTLGRPVVYTYHTKIQDYVHHIPFGRWPIVKPLVTRGLLIYTVWFCNQVNQVVTPSRVIQAELQQLGVKRPVEIIPTGVNLDEFVIGHQDTLRKQLINEWNINPRHRLLLYVSRLESEKNVPLLLKAYAKVQANFPRVTLLLVGGGSQTVSLKKLANQLKIDQAVRFIGQLPINETRRFYIGSDIFTFPSKTETQGIVVIEAMAGGLPVVAVNEGGPSELVNDQVDGFLVADDPRSFAEAVLKLLNDDRLYATMRRNALANAKKYSDQAMAQKMINLYYEVIGRPA